MIFLSLENHVEVCPVTSPRISKPVFTKKEMKFLLNKKSREKIKGGFPWEFHTAQITDIIGEKKENSRLYGGTLGYVL